jgi:hypothetical protein
VTRCPCEKEDIVEGMDGRREREYCCRVSGLLEQPAAADALQPALALRLPGAAEPQRSAALLHICGIFAEFEDKLRE